MDNPTIMRLRINPSPALIDYSGHFFEIQECVIEDAQVTLELKSGLTNRTFQVVAETDVLPTHLIDVLRNREPGTLFVILMDKFRRIYGCEIIPTPRDQDLL